MPSRLGEKCSELIFEYAYLYQIAKISSSSLMMTAQCIGGLGTSWKQFTRSCDGMGLFLIRMKTGKSLLINS